MTPLPVYVAVPATTPDLVGFIATNLETGETAILVSAWRRRRRRPRLRLVERPGIPAASPVGDEVAG